MKSRSFIAIIAILAVTALSGCSGGGGGTPETTPETTPENIPETTSDITPPSVPAGLVATAVSTSEMALSWNASTDDVAVSGYRIFRAGTEIGTSGTTAYLDTGLASSTTYTYTVASYDAAGNLSAQCSAASATTPASGPADTTPPAAPAIKLPNTGQAACYNDQGTVIPCANTGQNGDLNKGVAWPAQRFTANVDTSIIDNLTGLAWAPSGNLMPSRHSGWDSDKAQDDGSVTWQHALDYVALLNSENYLGHNDWRLPNRRELRSLASYGQLNSAAWLNSQGFTDVQAASYWSSTSWVVNASYAWYVNIYTGYVIDDKDKSETFYVWPVRTGLAQNEAAAPLPATGLTHCYDTLGALIPCANSGQDAALHKGVAWPSPRFSDNGDGTVIDKLTGLVWSQNGYAPGPAACSPGAAKTWQAALGYAACLNANNYLGHSDWRLPDINELESLIHAGQADNSSWLNASGFSHVQSGIYWSSTTYVTDARDACLIHMNHGDLWYDDKANLYFVWPVRGN